MIREAIREELGATSLEPAAGLDLARIKGPRLDDPRMSRIEYVQVTVELPVPVKAFFNGYIRWVGHEYWAPRVQGAGHWLLIRKDGADSRFTLYDKPGMRPLNHYGVVTELERGRRFAWRAPLSEWNQAYVGTILEIEPTSSNGVHVTETLYFDVREDHLPAIAGFMSLSGLDQAAISTFLKQRLRGLAEFILLGGFPSTDRPATASEPDEWRRYASAGRLLEWIELQASIE